MDWSIYKCRVAFVKELNAKLDSSPYPILKIPTAFDAITQDRVRELFDYDPKTGKLTDKQGKNVVVYGSFCALRNDKSCSSAGYLVMGARQT